MHLNPSVLFGLILLLGLIAGEIVKKVRFLPRIFGYIVAGFLIGPSAFHIISQGLLADARIFIDISLGLILFELGRHLDFSWLRRDPSLLLMSITEAALTFILIFSALILLGLPWLPAALAANIGIVTAPAVVMLVAHDLSAQGPVTRRALMLTSLNNFIGLFVFTFIIPLTQEGFSKIILLQQSVYRLGGSIILGILIFILTAGIAYIIGKRKENQFVLLTGAVVLAISLAHLLSFSVMLTLFIFGVSARNLDFKRWLVEIDFGWLARLFLILLFVLIGTQLQLQGLWQSTAAVITLILVRALAKLIGIGLFTRSSRLTLQQSFLISLALLPMAGVAIGMSNTVINFNAELGHFLTLIITAAIAVLDLIGPIAVQFAFLQAGEAAETETMQRGIHDVNIQTKS